MEKTYLGWSISPESDNKEKQGQFEINKTKNITLTAVCFVSPLQYAQQWQQYYQNQNQWNQYYSQYGSYPGQGSQGSSSGSQ